MGKDILKPLCILKPFFILSSEYLIHSFAFSCYVFNLSEEIFIYDMTKDYISLFSSVTL